MSYSGTSISDRLNGVIESLDKKTESKVKAEYGEDIASKVEHISKQIENLPEGGEGGGSSGGDERFVIVLQKYYSGMDVMYDVHPSYNEIRQFLNDVFEGKRSGVIDYIYSASPNSSDGYSISQCDMNPNVYIEGESPDAIDFTAVYKIEATSDIYKHSVMRLRVLPNGNVTKILDKTFDLYQA